MKQEEENITGNGHLFKFLLPDGTYHIILVDEDYAIYAATGVHEGKSYQLEHRDFSAFVAALVESDCMVTRVDVSLTELDGELADIKVEEI